MPSALMGAAKALQAQMGDSKPMTAVTDWIERLCSARYAEEDLDGVAELVQSINCARGPPTALTEQCNRPDRPKPPARFARSSSTAPCRSSLEL